MNTDGRDECEMDVVNAWHRDEHEASASFDLHCHWAFAENARDLADEASVRFSDMRFFCATVSPAEYESASDMLRGCSVARIGLGLHPWWVANGSCGEVEVARFERLAVGERWIGEVGLDFSPRWEHAREAQVAAFDRVLAACAAPGFSGERGVPDASGACAVPDISGACAVRRVISLHAVRSAGAVLDALERYDTARHHACIFHWFSGSSDELKRAIEMGCYFSIGERMLMTKRGRAYARAIPEDRLLLETDYPGEPVVSASLAEQCDSLGRALRLLADARGGNADELAACIERTSLALLE